MITNNPHIKEQQQLIVELDRARARLNGMTRAKGSDQEHQVQAVTHLQVKLEVVESKSRQFTQKILNNHYSELAELTDRAETISEDKIPITTQYKALCKLYREAMSLVDNIRDSKKMIRQEIKVKRNNHKGGK